MEIHSFNWQTEGLLREMIDENLESNAQIIRVFMAKTFIETKVTGMKLQGFNL